MTSLSHKDYNYVVMYGDCIINDFFSPWNHTVDYNV